MSFDDVKDFIASFAPTPLCFDPANLWARASVYFFHIRRVDGVLERDELGLELSEGDLLREADAGARGLLIESIAEGTDAFYQRFEIADEKGRTVLTFDFAVALRTIRCVHVDGGLSAGLAEMRPPRHNRYPDEAAETQCPSACDRGPRAPAAFPVSTWRREGNRADALRIRTDDE